MKYLVHSIFGAIHLYALHFIDGGIAILRFMQTAYDGEQRGVVTFRLSFKYEPTDVSDEEYCHTNGILAFAVIFVVVIFVYMSMRLQQQKAENRNFIETYTITLTKGFAGDSTSIFINDSLLVNRTMTEEPFILEVKRFAEQSALMIVNNATEKLSLFELSEKGGEYRFEKEGEEVKQLAQE